MINLRCRSEYSFRKASGSIKRILEVTKGPVGLCDRCGTWGHADLAMQCKAAGRKAIFGVELPVVQNATLREKQGANMMAFIARTNAGLKQIYELTSLATTAEHFYYTPRIDYGDLMDLTDDVIILSGSHPQWELLPRTKNVYIELSPTSSPQAVVFAREHGLQCVATSDNLFPTPEDQQVYEVLAGQDKALRASAMHLLTDWEWLMLFPGRQDVLDATAALAESCDVTLPKASVVKHTEPRSLREICLEGAQIRGVDLTSQVYADRLDRELSMIHEKEFDDYFYLVWDMVKYAKQHMLVGPARGSSCGSLVCYLMFITEIDPIPYSLLFERFIDINRKDYPDIDIDFPDDRRDMVFEYLRERYGVSNVVRLGTILRYKAKSAIDLVARELQIPTWEVKTLKDSILERSGGDARAAFCIADTFTELEIGKQTLAKYPELILAAKFEEHASTSGQHAAGIVVTADPVVNYCSVNQQTLSAMIDKHDAEDLNLLKIDALGLRTLSVIQDCIDQIGMSRDELLKVPLDDQSAFDMINNKKDAGIFQFEGGALRMLCSQLYINQFEDLASMTALARPGPLHSGGAAEFLKRRNGEHEAAALHPSIKHITDVTYGVVIYQEQVMQIAREMGKLSWEDVSSLRKAMSKSLGKEFFDKYWDRFKVGAAEQGVSETDALSVWNQINTMGSWSFNRSHAVAYALVSYWCMYLKAHHPLEWGAAVLRNARSDDQSIQLLRELVNEGYEYKPFDAELSQVNWSVQNGKLIGGLINVKGVGPKTAEDIMRRRKDGERLSLAMRTKLANAVTPFDCVFECREKWGHIKENPRKYGIASKMSECTDIQADDNEQIDVVFIAKVVQRDLRDLNDPTHLKKRNGRAIQGNSLMLLFLCEDDTGQVPCAIDRRDFELIGRSMVEGSKLGDWFLLKGYVKRGFRQVRVVRWKKLTGSDFEKGVASDGL